MHYPDEKAQLATAILVGYGNSADSDVAAALPAVNGEASVSIPELRFSGRLDWGAG